MEDTQTTPAPAENGATTSAQTVTEQPQAETPAKTLTQAEVDKIVAARLERERKGWETEKAEIERRAKMDEAERLKAEKADLEKQIQSERDARTSAERRAALVGKVADPAAALKLLEPAHIGEDGAVNVEALLKSYPFLAAQSGKSAVGAANPAGGGTGKPTSIFAALQQEHKR